MSAKSVNSLTLETFKTLFDTHLSPEDQIAFTEYANKSTSVALRYVYDTFNLMIILHKHGHTHLVKYQPAEFYKNLLDDLIPWEISPLQIHPSNEWIFDPENGWLMGISASVLCKSADEIFIYDHLIPEDCREEIYGDYVSADIEMIPRLLIKPDW
jgi:hypothetical protein